MAAVLACCTCLASRSLRSPRVSERRVEVGELASPAGGTAISFAPVGTPRFRFDFFLDFFLRVRGTGGVGGGKTG